MNIMRCRRVPAVRRALLAHRADVRAVWASPSVARRMGFAGRHVEVFVAAVLRVEQRSRLQVLRALQNLEVAK